MWFSVILGQPTVPSEDRRRDIRRLGCVTSFGTITLSDRVDAGLGVTYRERKPMTVTQRSIPSKCHSGTCQLDYPRRVRLRARGCMPNGD